MAYAPVEYQVNPRAGARRCALRRQGQTNADRSHPLLPSREINGRRPHCTHSLTASSHAQPKAPRTPPRRTHRVTRWVSARRQGALATPTRATAHCGSPLSHTRLPGSRALSSRANEAPRPRNAVHAARAQEKHRQGQGAQQRLRASVREHGYSRIACPGCYLDPSPHLRTIGSAFSPGGCDACEYHSSP